MPISFNESDKVFHLQGKTFSYCLMLHPEQGLLNLYWGSRLPDGEITYLINSFWGLASFDLGANRFPTELPTRGTGYYGTPAVCALNAQGNDLTKLTYVSHAIVPGKRRLEGLPAVYTEADSEATTLVITLKDALTGLTVEAEYTVLEDLDALTRSLRLTNGGAERLTLTHMQSASAPLYGDDYELINLNGAWARERQVVRTPLGRANTRVESQRGASGHEQNPFIALVKKDTTEQAGSAWAMALVYSGSFLATAEVNNFYNTRMSIGLNPEVCRWQLDPGASFQTPEAILVYSAEGLNGMSHRFHRIIRTRVARGYWRDKVRPVLINNWEATYFGFNEELILNIARAAKEIGVELFVLDDGWFGKRDRDNCSLGDWVVDRRKLPGGIEGVARKVNELGLRFGLWFEPEMISPDSDLYRAHPDWCLHVDGRSRTEARQQLILDLSRKEVQDYVIEAVSSVLRSAPISYVKWDMNRNMTEYFSGDQTPDRQMETQHRYILGLYRVLEEITSAFPEVLFEGCSGGGGRFDAGFLYYMPQFWTSDDTDPVERLGIQYGTSFVYPPATMGAHVSASPNHQTGRATSIKMRADVALGGNFGFELDLNKLTQEEIEACRKAVETVKAVRGTLQQGEFTRLESPFEGNFAAWQFVGNEGRDVVLCAYQRLVAPNPGCHRVFMTGLCPDARYRDAESGQVFSGAALMHAGLPLRPIRSDFGSWIFRFERV
ncbi:MAG: alpha-galactosidase [Clostridia bacterium]|nr:alpha-galactosidase [Clostridia bacterium]